MKCVKRNLYIGILSLAIVTACGGGGSVSDAGNGVKPELQNAVAAKPTVSNGREVADIVATDQRQSVPGLNRVNDNVSINTTLFLNQLRDLVLLDFKAAKSDSYTLNEVVNETEQCTGGGVISYSGSGNDTTGGSVNVVYKNCRQGSVTYNGRMKLEISNYSAALDGFKNIDIKLLSDLAVKNSSTGESITIKEGSFYNTDISEYNSDGEPKKMKMTVSTTAFSGSKKSSQQNSVYYIANGNSSTRMYQTAGKLYFNKLTSYVDYDKSYDMSKTPFVYDKRGVYSGTGRYNMQGKAKLKIVVESLNNVRIYIDSDGNGVYETVD